MPLSTKRRNLAHVVAGMVVMSQMAYGQGGFAPQGGEYSIAGHLSGDQAYADLSLDDDGGYLVWEDNHTDGDGAGISALRVDTSGTSAYEVFQVNSIESGNQEKPGLATLSDGSQMFVWQGGPENAQSIFGRVVGADGVFVNESDVQISSHTGSAKMSVDVASTGNGGSIVVWSSFGQDDANNADVSLRNLRGVYGQRVNSSGELVGGEFLVNESVEFGQRSPAVVGLADGKFLVVWVTEKVTGFGNSQDVNGVNLLGRFFSDQDGQSLGGEFRINTGTNLCANPSLTATDDGGFTVAWSERGRHDLENSWDIALRHYSASDASSGGEQILVNSHVYGDQFSPQIGGSGSQQLVVWTSMGQDGSKKGVFGRFVSLGQLTGDEFQVNTQTASQQHLPAVSAFGESSLLVTWSSFVGGESSVDLLAQRYSVSIPKPGAPIVSASSSYELFVAWPEIAGFEVESYLLFVDNGVDPIVTGDAFYRLAGLNPGSSHSVRLAYKLQDGRVSPISDTSTGTTFGGDFNFDGLPDDWQESQFGADPENWDGPLVDTDGDGVSNLNEFLAGTLANDPDSLLVMGITQSTQGWQLSWNSVPGLVYEVHASGDLDSWTDVGGYRFSAGAEDSVFVQPGSGMEYYRVVRIR